jgi:hypothetical protein
MPTEVKSDGERLLAAEENKLTLEDSGCWATLEEENIKVFGKDGATLFGVNPKIIPFERRPLCLLLQIWLMGYNTGRQGGVQEAKNKITELIKLAL